MSVSRVATLLALAALPALATAQSDELLVTVGLRAWHATFSAWTVTKGPLACQIVGAPPDCGFPDQTANFEPENRPLMLIPTLSLRKGSWLLSGSYAVAPTYRFAVLDQTAQNKRREIDASVGYLVLPSASVTLGYKELRQDIDGERLVYRGPTLGVSGSAPLTAGGVSIYANAAFGLPGYFEARVNESEADAQGRRKFDVSYRVFEAGVAFPFSLGAPGARPLVLTVGYRGQNAKIKNYRLSAAPGVTFTTGLNDDTYGFVMGLSKTF